MERIDASVIKGAVEAPLRGEDLSRFASPDVIVTIVDQALISVQNFAVGAFFVAFGQKAAYATYVMLFGFILLATSFQNASILTAFTTHAVRLEGAERRVYKNGMFLLQAVLGVLAAAIAYVGVSAWGSAGGGDSGWLSVGFAAAVFGSLLREYRRTEQVLERRLSALLWGDVISVGLSLAALVALILRHEELEAGVVLFILGTSAALPCIRPLRGLRSLQREWAIVSRPGQDLADTARWTVPWTIVSWIQNNSYPYLIAGLTSAAAVADAAASRLFLGPLALIGTGWNRVFLPAAGRLIVRGDTRSVRRRAGYATFVLGVGIALYVGAVLVGSHVGAFSFLPAAYAHIGPLMGLWGLCFLASNLRGVVSTALLAHKEFRAILVRATVALTISLPAMIALSRIFGVGGILLGITLGEGVLTALLWIHLRGVAGAIVATKPG